MRFYLPPYRRTALFLTVLFFLVLLPVAPLALAQNPTPIQTIESDDPRVIQSGAWSSQAATPASNGSYLFSSGAETDILGLSFVGSAIEIIYVSGPQFGTLAIEVDGTVLRTVITTAEKIEYAQSTRLDYLSDEPHSLKVYAQSGGIVAVDAFRITPLSLIVGDGPVPSQAIDDGTIQSSTCAPLNATHRVSLTHTGAQANHLSGGSALSVNGRYVALVSSASLVPGDSDAFSDVYVYDRQTCAVQWVSVSSAGVDSNGEAEQPAISANGRYVVFLSLATNLVAGDTNGFSDIFVHDRQTATTTRVSVATGGAQATGGFTFYSAISADGRFVAFESDASNLVASDTNMAGDIFVHDRNTATTTRVSVATGGAQATGGASSHPAISADGRYVAFRSTATNLAGGDTNGVADIFVHDRNAATTTRVSLATGGAQATGFGASDPTISADGRYVTFDSFAPNLVAGDTNATGDIFVHDRQTTTTTRVSVATGGAQATGNQSFQSSISPDGRYVVFSSAANNLITGDTNSTYDIFVHDRNTATTTRVSVATGGAQAIGGDSLAPEISGDGRYVAFDSFATNLVAGDTNAQLDVFVTPRAQSTGDTLALFNPAHEHVDLLDTLADNPAAERYTAFSAYAPPTTAGQWVMGDWNGDGLDTPGLYMNGPLYYTNKSGESQASDWRSLWIGVAGPPVAGRFDDALPNDCIGAVQSANFPPFGTAFVLYYTCDLSGNTAPTISFQWLSVVLPDSGGFSGTHQFGAGDFDNDGDDSVAIRRGTFIAFGNVAPVDGVAAFDLAQFIGAPGTGDAGTFVVGDWNADRVDSFGLYYQNGELFYRNDLDFNSGAYVNQSVGTPFGNSGVQATTWR